MAFVWFIVKAAWIHVVLVWMCVEMSPLAPTRFYCKGGGFLETSRSPLSVCTTTRQHKRESPISWKKVCLVLVWM